MKPSFKCFFILIVSMIFLQADADIACSGKFVNPITDVCWSCLFPLTMGSIQVIGSHYPDTENPSNPVCTCQKGIIPQIGVTVGYWEPIRLVDVTRHPYCFVNLGGIQMNWGGDSQTGTVVSRTMSHEAVSTYQVHFYIYPLLYWLNIMTDASCVEKGDFDIAYITELDPTWNDDQFTFILNPDAFLFANPASQLACASDCAAATLHLPMNSLYWCAGCQGAMFPLNGHVQDHEGGVQASLLLAERMTFKLHRENLLLGTYGSKALCHPYEMLTMDQAMYRSQMVFPVATTSSSGCNPFARTTSLWETLHEFPISGEDFGYLIWRKRNCCSF